MSSVMGKPPSDVQDGREPDPAAAASPAQAGTAPAPQAPGADPADPAGPPARGCRHCGSPLMPGQDWCLNCGAGAPGSLENQRWRSSTAVAVGVAVLALGAAAASYAALNEHSPKRATVVKQLVAAVPATPATPPGTTTPTTPPATPTHPTLPIPLQKTKLPKIPLNPITPPKATPKATEEGGKSSKGSSGKEDKEQGGASKGQGEQEASEPEAILLDTNAASTYDPYALPASFFGDPSLVIDGDDATAWTAQVNPASAPAMAEGLLIDLKSPQKVGAMELDTDTKGMTVQVYGTNASTPPGSILAKEWTALSRPRVLKKRATRIKLRVPKKGTRYVLTWISKAPADQLGTAQAPGHVAVNEIELFPPT